MFNILKSIFQKPAVEFVPISQLPDDYIQPGEAAHVFVYAKEKLAGSKVEQLESEYLLKLNSETIKKFDVYETPHVKNTSTGRYEEFDNRLVHKGNCPVCGNRMETDLVYSLEYREEFDSGDVTKVKNACSLLSIHATCIKNYDMRDFAIAPK